MEHGKAEQRTSFGVKKTRDLKIETTVIVSSESRKYFLILYVGD